MPRAFEHAFRDKSRPPGPIWRIVAAQPADGDKSIRPARIRHVLQVTETGERGLSAYAEAQEGLVHRSQLLAVGISRGSIAHRVKIGSLHPAGRNVFAVGHAALGSRAPETAALLSVGNDCLLSHASGVAIWGLVDSRSDLVEVTVAGRNVRQRPGVRVYRVAELDSRDVRLRDGLPVTSPARALIDFAGRRETGDAELARALSEARVQHLVTDRELIAAMARCPARTGVARVRDLLEQHNERINSRHEAERRLMKLIGQARLPMPEANAHVLGHEVDLLWQAEKLVVEMDGWAFHGHRAAFERDRDRDQRLVAAGYRVIRITWRQLQREPFVVVARIAQALRGPQP